MSYSTTVLLRLTPEMLEALWQLADARGRSRSVEIRSALTKHIADARAQQRQLGYVSPPVRL